MSSTYELQIWTYAGWEMAHISSYYEDAQSLADRAVSRGNVTRIVKIQREIIWKSGNELEQLILEPERDERGE